MRKSMSRSRSLSVPGRLTVAGLGGSGRHPGRHGRGRGTQATLVLAVYLVALTVAAAVQLQRRDIT
jgi:hypothetical protein